MDPSLAVPLSVKLLSFSVAAGASLTGRVTQLSHSHIGLLVSGVFNAAINCEHLPSSWAFYPNNSSADEDGIGGHWCTQKGGGGVSVRDGSKITFNVVNTRMANGVLMINGSIPDSRNGSSSSSSSSAVNDEQLSGSKKHKLEEQGQQKKPKKSKA